VGHSSQHPEGAFGPGIGELETLQKLLLGPKGFGHQRELIDPPAQADHVRAARDSNGEKHGFSDKPHDVVKAKRCPGLLSGIHGGTNHRKNRLAGAS